MNIEEERKAFVEFMDNLGDRQVTWLDIWLAAKAHADSDIKMLLRVCAFESIEHTRKWDVDKECQHVTALTAQQFFDDGFAKGMTHAAEMAKPVYNPEPYNGGWGVQDLQHKYWHTLQTKAQAIEEAKEQGYRVIE